MNKYTKAAIAHCLPYYPDEVDYSCSNCRQFIKVVLWAYEQLYTESEKLDRYDSLNLRNTIKKIKKELKKYY